MGKIKRIIGLSLMMIFIISAASVTFAANSGTIDEFINDARWKDGAYYKTSYTSGTSDYAQAPHLWPGTGVVPCRGCRAYVYDFVAYVYGIYGNPPYKGTSYGNNSSEIRRGDVIYCPGVSGSYADHWFVVLGRNGNSLTTAEAASNRVYISNSHFSISGNQIYFSWDGKRNRNFTGYHYGTVPDDKFFDFWGFENNTTVSGTYKIWWKQTGYSNGNYVCDVNLDINGTALGTIYQDANGYFSYEFDSTKYANGAYTFGAIIRSTDGSEKYVTRTINISNYINIGDLFYATITNAESGMAIANINNDVKLDYETAYKTKIWKFERYSDNSYKISNLDNGYCLDVYGGANVDGTNIQVYPDNGSDGQRWYLAQKGNSYVIYSAIDKNKSLDVTGWGTDVGTNIQLYTSSQNTAQVFNINNIRYNDSLTYDICDLGDTFNAYILATSSEQAVTATTDNVMLWHKDNPDTLWYFDKQKDGTYRITSESYNCVIRLLRWNRKIRIKTAI